MKHKLLLLLLFIITSSFAQNKNKTIGFKENKGQIIDQKGKPNNAVKYLLNSGGLNVQLKKNGFSYDIYEVKKHPINHSRDDKSKPLPFPSKDNEKLPDYTLEYQYHRIDIDFLNSNSKVELITEEKSLDYDNYYNIPNKPEGILMVHQYKQITYKNIYPNIDVVFSVPKDTLKTVEYNFVVHPKGKISDIQLKFSGAQTELVDNKIRMSVRFGEMEETLPASWTEDGESKKEIAVGYTKIKKNVYGFESSENVFEKTVIIDPVPVRLWGTFYGDQTNIHYALGEVSIATDSSGNSYMTGTTTASNSSYATTGAHQTSIVSNSYPYLTANGIIVKFDPNGNRLWGTYYGGQGINKIKDIKIDYQNNVVIVGHTPSQTNISTIEAYKPNLIDGDDDAFLVKFNNSGIRIWGTYFGGETSDSANALSIDKNNNIYIVGTTLSKTNIAVNSNFQTQLNDGYYRNDGFLSKFTADGNLIWSTYVGGDGRDELKAIVVKDNYLITGGDTESFNKITTAGVFQESHDSFNHSDCVVYKFSLDGQRIWATYYGGEQVDYLYTVEADDEDNVYLGGETGSFRNMTTPGSFDSINQSLYEGFFAKLNSKGERVWGTYLGSAYVYSLIFKNNSIYIGATNNDAYTTNLTDLCSYRPNNDLYSQGYIAKFSKQCSLIWGTFIGGRSTYKSTKIVFDNNNAIFVAGISSQNNGIADSNSYQPNVLGGENYFLMKFSEGDLCNIDIKPMSNSPVCIASTLSFSNVPSGYHYDWTGPNGFTSNVQNPIINNVNTTNSGLYTLIISDGTNCGCKMTYKMDVIVGDKVAPIPNLATLPTITGDCHTLITTIPTATDTCAGAITATTTSPLSYSLPGTYTVVWNYNDGAGNSINQNQTVIIPNQQPTASSSQSFCIQQNATLNDIAITGQNVKWYDALTAGNLLLNTTSLQNGITYYASQTINGCESERTPVLINIQNTLAPTGNTKQYFCTGQNPTLSTITVVGSAIKCYDSATLGNLLADTTPLVDGKTYYVSQTLNNCESTNRLAITVSLISSLPANDYDFSICDDLNDGKEIIKLEDYNSYLISNTTNYNFSYYKSLSDAENELTDNKITSLSNYKLALGENKIYVRINSNTPCYAIVVLKITLLPKPVIPIQDIVPICENKSILIDAGIGADSYLWSNGTTTQTITVDNPRDLSVIVTKNHSTISCSSEKSFTVKTSNVAKISSIETKDWTDNNNSITVFATGLGDYEYSIDGTNFQANNLFSGVNSGEYKIYVRDKNGCGTTTEEVYLLMYPKFFTPNGDGYNDTWKIQSSDNEKNLTLKIFDRFGKLLKELDSNSSGWDGTYTGQPLPATDYWFVVTRKDGTEHKGHFSLKR
jgi:gliding motility-associated-like protein